MLTNPCLCYIICLVRSERKALRRGNGGVAQLARASGSYPAGRWFKSDRRYHFWPVGQAVKTPPFHGGNMGSIPVRVTNKKQLSKEGCFFPFIHSLSKTVEIGKGASAPRRQCGVDFEPIYSAKIYSMKRGPRKINRFCGETET